MLVTNNNIKKGVLMSDPITLYKLPFELIAKIVSFLPRRDRGRIAAVASALNEAVLLLHPCREFHANPNSLCGNAYARVMHDYHSYLNPNIHEDALQLSNVIQRTCDEAKKNFYKNINTYRGLRLPCLKPLAG